MGEQFVPYKYALQLQTLGIGDYRFNLLLGCFAYYGANKSIYKGQLIPNNTFTKHSNFDYSEFVFAPLWQQAFDWFVKEHSLSAEIYNFRSKWNIDFWNIEKQSTAISFQPVFDTYEEAREVALIKLIEKVNGKSQHNTAP